MNTGTLQVVAGNIEAQFTWYMRMIVEGKKVFFVILTDQHSPFLLSMLTMSLIPQMSILLHAQCRRRERVTAQTPFTDERPTSCLWYDPFQRPDGRLCAR